MISDSSDLIVSYPGMPAKLSSVLTAENLQKPPCSFCPAEPLSFP